MLADADIAFSGCGFMGIYYVGVSKCIDTLAPDLLQRRIGGASAGTRVDRFPASLPAASGLAK